MAVAALVLSASLAHAAPQPETEAPAWLHPYNVINPGKTVADPAWEAGRNHQLFRAMLGANSSGRLPTLFNGGPFLFEANPNERQWAQSSEKSKKLRDFSMGIFRNSVNMGVAPVQERARISSNVTHHKSPCTSPGFIGFSER